MSGYGFTCFGCRRALNLDTDDWNVAEAVAGAVGWCIGHYDGQGQIVCPGCRPAIWEAAPLDRLPEHGLDVRRRVDLAGMECSAAFSPCGAYRYLLTWRWSSEPALVAWMLNPSTADHENLDPTVSGLMSRARRWSLGAVTVINLFAYRATAPADMKAARDPVGPLNDLVTQAVLAEQAQAEQPVLCAWGAHGTYRKRHAAALDQAKRAGVRTTALRLTNDGQPGHPLYIPHAVEPVPWPSHIAAALDNAGPLAP